MIEFVNADFLAWDTDRTFPLVIADPPYNHIVEDKWDWEHKDDLSHLKWMLDWTNHVSKFQNPGDALYVWGGVGKPKNRAFFRYLVELEHSTPYQIKNYITWSKRRAYGVSDNYLFTREECLYLIHSSSKPNTFNIPLLAEERGYAGYNPKYPAKSKYKRRTNVWTDVTEIFRGKVHSTEKPARLSEIMIETHTKPHDVVLDPFAGSGSVGIAARNTGRSAVLVEKNPEIYHLMQANVEEKS